MKRRKLNRAEKRERKMQKFIYSETSLIRGLVEDGHPDAKEVWQKARGALTQGIDWSPTDEHGICFSKEGAEKCLNQFLELKNGGEKELEQAPPPPESEERMLTVHALQQNPRMLLASDGFLIRSVEVGDSANFIVGMKLKAIPHPTASGYWLLVGPRPKYKGRW
jgi:hypothetical protein